MSERNRLAPDPRVVMCGQSPVSSLIFGPQETCKDHPVVVSGHDNGRIIEWSVVTQRITVSWQGHTESVIWLAWTVPDKLLSQGRDGLIRIWCRDVKAWISIGEIPCAQFVFCDSAVFRHNNHFKLAIPSDGTSHIDVHILEETVLTSPLPTTAAPESHRVSTLSHSFGPTSAKAYGMCMRIRVFISSSHDPRLLVGYENGALTLWDLLSGDLLNEVKAYDDSIMALDFWENQETNAATCISGSANEILKLWHIEGDKFVEGASISVTNPGIGAIAIRGDGRIFASGGWDHRGRIFSLRKLKALAVLTYHTSSVQCVTFAPDNTLATGSKDGYIALWDVYKNR